LLGLSIQVPLLGRLLLALAIQVLLALLLRRRLTLSGLFLGLPIQFSLLGHLLLVPGAQRPRADPDRPSRLVLVALTERAPLRQIAAAGHDDPVYGAGLRVLLPPSRPLIVIPSLPVQNGFWAAGGFGGRLVVTQRLTACGSWALAQS